MLYHIFFFFFFSLVMFFKNWERRQWQLVMVVYISWKKSSFEYSLSRFLLQSTRNHVLQHLLQLHWLLGHSWFSILEWLLLSITKKRHITKPSCNACEFSKHKRCPFLLALTKRRTSFTLIHGVPQEMYQLLDNNDL